jgi:hypothetical protein
MEADIPNEPDFFFCDGFVVKLFAAAFSAGGHGIFAGWIARRFCCAFLYRDRELIATGFRVAHLHNFQLSTNSRCAILQSDDP